MTDQLLFTTMNSIGDAVIATDAEGRITFMNPVAERVTGWRQTDAMGRDSNEVFRIVNEKTRQEVENPIDRVIREGVVVGLANHTVLLSKDGREIPIDDSGAPIRNETGDLLGVVLVFRDVTERKDADKKIQAAREYAESIVETVREPLVILDADLRVISANRAFYRTFAVEPNETAGRMIYDLGNGQWNVPALRTLLEEILPQNSHFDDFEIEHDFESIGRKTMLLNARRMFQPDNQAGLILLAIEDVTDRKLALEQLQISEVRYRRLFEAARDGILILDLESTAVTDSNPYMTELLGYTREEFVGKELADIGLFRDRAASKKAMTELKEKEHIRYDDLPLQSKSGQRRDVEFVSNVYQEDGRSVIQCNIRDITDRKRLADAMARHQSDIVLLNEQTQRAMMETHHRVKNNLQILAALVDMRLMDNREMVPASDLRRIETNIRTFATVHDLLTLQTRQSGEAESVSAKATIEKLLASIEQTNGEVRIDARIDEAQVPARVATSLAIVLNELVSNAIKHGGGVVEVTYSVTRAGSKLSVCDNGPGFDPDFDPDAAAHTGLELVTMVTRWDFGGRAVFRNRPEGGACVEVTIL